MKKKTKIYLVQVTYSTDKYEYGLFYILSNDEIGYIDKKLFIIDKDIEFIDGEDGVNIFIYDDYNIEVTGHSNAGLEVKIEANRHRFYVFKPLSLIKEKGATYDYYYRIKKGGEIK